MKKFLKRICGRPDKTGAFTSKPETKRNATPPIDSRKMQEATRYISTHFGRALERLGDR